MPTATRQSIMSAVEIRMGGIATFGSNVYIWRKSDLPLDQLPLLNIMDSVDSMPSDGIGNRRDHDLSVDLEAYFSGSTSAAAARQIIADIVAAIGTDKTWGGLAYDTLIDTAEIRLEEMGKVLSAAQVNITIRYRSELWTI
jgi:hypothetical protein